MARVIERANAGHLGRVERRVIRAITACRTAALGGHVERCEDCGPTRIAYNSCRNRHCPKCQGWRERNGLPRGKPNCCRCPISMSSSPCRRRRPRSPFRTSRRSMPPDAHRGRGALDDRRYPQPRRRDRPHRHSAHLGPDPPASSPCPLRAARRGPLARWRSLDRLPEGLLPVGAGPVAPLPPPVPRRLDAAFGRQPGLLRRSRQACRSPPPSPDGAIRYAASTAWSMPSRPSAGRSRCSPISAAIRIASPSPTPGSLPSMTGTLQFPWKDYRHGGKPKVMALAALRVHPPLPSPHVAGRLPSHSSLRLPG